MSDPILDDVLLSSVPDQEVAFAREHLSGARLISRPLSPDLAVKHADVRVLAPMIHDPVTEEALEAFDALEAVVTRSDGYDHLPLAWMREHDVAGYHLEGYATESVAHHAVMMILALIRRVPEAEATTTGTSPRWERSHLMGRHLQDVTVGVLGVGRIGSRVAELVTAMGGTAVGQDIEPDPALDALEGFAWADGFDALLEASDVLTVHVPLDETTEAMIGHTELSRLGDRACLVNTARGGIVDQAAVAEMLDEGTLAGYAADVLPGEPDPPDLEVFAGRERVLLTPHLAAYDERTTEARYARTGQIARAVLEDRVGDVDAYRIA